MRLVSPDAEEDFRGQVVMRLGIALQRGLPTAEHRVNGLNVPRINFSAM